MSEHIAALQWRRETPSFDYPKYNRSHEVTFKNGLTVRFSAAVAYHGDAHCVDPEEAFVAALASCHMLTFLAIASEQGFVVDSYRDEATGHLEKNAEGKLALTRIELRPFIAFAPGAAPDEATLRRMHEEAHEECFIAHSVLTAVTIEPTMERSSPTVEEGP
jgi:organic hydroperoxide reductase OsmC/OhrA